MSRLWRSGLKEPSLYESRGGSYFSFLAGGPRFELELPAYFDALPELDSPIFNGISGRSFTFLPQGRDQSVDVDSTFLRALVDAGGRTVEFYERVDPPQLWWLRWQLSTGALYTHLRSEDGVTMAEKTVGSISVVEDSDTGTPFLLPEAPLSLAASAAPGYQETAMYFSAERGEGWSVTLTRPGFVPAGSIAVAPTDNTGGLVVMRAGIGQGVELTVSAGRDNEAAEEVLSMAMDSLTQG
jgi:hypothetical protein